VCADLHLAVTELHRGGEPIQQPRPRRVAGQCFVGRVHLGVGGRDSPIEPVVTHPGCRAGTGYDTVAARRPRPQLSALPACCCCLPAVNTCSGLPQHRARSSAPSLAAPRCPAPRWQRPATARTQQAGTDRQKRGHRLFPDKNSFRARVSYPTEIKKIRVG
jgi:hypothetical protein